MEDRSIEEDACAEETDLLVVVHFVRHLDRILHHRRAESAAAALHTAADDGATKFGVEEEEEGSSAEELDFVPCQLRLMGPVEVARRVLCACPRAYRTAFAHNWPRPSTDREAAAAGKNRSDEDGGEDDDSLDGPLHGLLARGGSHECRGQEEEEEEAREAFAIEECEKLLPVRKRAKAFSDSSFSDVPALLKEGEGEEGGSCGEEGDNGSEEEGEDDALLQQYYRSQTSLGAVFVQLMLRLPSPSGIACSQGEITARELETRVYSEVLMAGVCPVRVSFVLVFNLCPFSAGC